MALYISRIEIRNFRNFKDFTVNLSEKAIIVGENRVGKSNLLYALRLILDPSLSARDRQLTSEDFWHGINDPIQNGNEILITIHLRGFDTNPAIRSILDDYVITPSPLTASLSYNFKPSPILGGQAPTPPPPYEYVVFGGGDPAKVFDGQKRNWIPFDLLPALRNAERDLQSWRDSPLKPLIDRLNITEQDLRAAALKMDEANTEVEQIPSIQSLNQKIKDRVDEMIGKYQQFDPTLSLSAMEVQRLLRLLKLFIDGTHKREIFQNSLGLNNVLYLALLMLNLEEQEDKLERAGTILGIEEPEAHLHPHLQRLVFSDFFEKDRSSLLSTHSPHITSVAPIDSIVLMRNIGTPTETIGFSTVNAGLASLEKDDLQRYMDVNRGELYFARGVILVEGIAEMFLIPAFAKAMGFSFDELGISVCNVHGTDFVPYVKLIRPDVLNLPFVILTDADPQANNGTITYRAHKRGVDLASLYQTPQVSSLAPGYSNVDWEAKKKEFKSAGIFVNSYTLEVDLIQSGYSNQFIETYKELGATAGELTNFTTGIQNLGNSQNLSYVLGRISSKGKGRFAQRFAEKISPTVIPDYISEAINEIIRKTSR